VPRHSLSAGMNQDANASNVEYQGFHAETGSLRTASRTISYIDDACAYDGFGMFIPATGNVWKYSRW
jgi:hypothetical protein